MRIEANIQKAANALQDADAVFITAGRDLRIAPHLPSLYGRKQVLSAYPQLKQQKVSLREMASPYWFHGHPNLAWGIYGTRFSQGSNTKLDAGFNDLRDIAYHIGYYFVFTTIIDSPFQQAGFDPMSIVDCNGSLHKVQCSRNCKGEIYETKDIQLNIDSKTLIAADPLPTCLHCGSLLRPNIIMSNDLTWNNRQTLVQINRLRLWVRKLKDNNLKTVIIELGTTRRMKAVRYETEGVLQDLNATLIRINTRDYQVSQGQISIPCEPFEGIRGIKAAMNLGQSQESSQ